jgi:hypothetical protein
MESEGHKIHFKVLGELGYILIMRVGWIGFEYSCFIGGNMLLQHLLLSIVTEYFSMIGEQVLEATQIVAENQEPMYSVDLIEHMSTPDEFSEQYIVWYVINTKRLSDGMCTTVLNYIFLSFQVLSLNVLHISHLFIRCTEGSEILQN